MQIDEESFIRLESHGGRATFRIYRWDRLCVSIGRYQRADFKLPTVRRPTGGGALIHGWDISFSITAERRRFGNSPKTIYLKLARKLVETFGMADMRVHSSSRNYSLNNLCYFIPSPGEISADGRKLFALAMRTGRKAFLIQGTVYEHFDYSTASEILKVEEELLRERITSLREVGMDRKEFTEKLLSLLKKLSGEN